MKVSTPLLLALGAIALTGCEPIDKHDEVCKVLSIDKQVVTYGDKDGISTSIYWLVVTDHGTFHISTDGFFPCPEAVGTLQVDSVYTLTVDGWFSSSFLGAYPYIVNVKPQKR